MASLQGKTTTQQTLNESTPSNDTLNPIVLLLNQLLYQRAPFYSEHFNATLSPKGLSFDQWTTAHTYQNLIARFSIAHPSAEPAHHNENTTTKTHVGKAAANNLAPTLGKRSKDTRKALHSLWGQWYFGLLVPPMMEWIFNAPQAAFEHINWQQQSFFIQPHTDGRVAKFEFKISTSKPVTTLAFKKLNGPLISKTQIQLHPSKPLINKEFVLQHFILNLLLPSVERLLSLSPAPAKLYWSHLGYLIHWYLGELGLTAQYCQQLKQTLFRRMTFLDGTTNPLYNSINLIEKPQKYGAKQPQQIHCIRRTCCLRYQLANTAQCHDCPLLSRQNAKRNSAK